MDQSDITTWLGEHGIIEDDLDDIVTTTAEHFYRIKGNWNASGLAKEMALDLNFSGIDSQVNYLVNFYGSEYIVLDNLAKDLSLPKPSEQ
jgi:hypothetical protein